MYGFVASFCFSTRGFVNNCFNVWKAVYSSVSHLQEAFFLDKLLKGLGISKDLGMNRWYQEVDCKDDRTCWTVRGAGILWIVAVLSGSTAIPEFLIQCPKYFTRGQTKLHFSRSARSLNCKSLSNTAVQYASDSLKVIIIPSRYESIRMSCRPLRKRSINF